MSRGLTHLMQMVRHCFPSARLADFFSVVVRIRKGKGGGIAGAFVSIAFAVCGGDTIVNINAVARFACDASDHKARWIVRLGTHNEIAKYGPDRAPGQHPIAFPKRRSNGGGKHRIVKRDLEPAKHSQTRDAQYSGHENDGPK